MAPKTSEMVISYRGLKNLVCSGLEAVESGAAIAPGLPADPVADAAHYYGPYSADIAEAAEDATLFGCLEFEEHSGFYNIPYGTYEVSDKNLHIPANIGSLDKDTVQSKINIMSNYSAIELELAATIQYLRKQGSVNAIEEVKQLKPAKATDSRMARARSLLLEMGIS